MGEQMALGQEPLPKTNSDKVAPATLGLAIASLVLGILSIVMSIFLVGAILGIVGCLLGITHLSKKPLRKTMVWWGVSLSIVGILTSCSMGFLYFRFFRYIASDFDGTFKQTPVPQVSDLDKSSVELALLKRWEILIQGAEGMCVGDWILDGKPELLVTDDKSKLHVINTSGK